MEKKSLARKLAEKALNSGEVKRSWDTHAQAFGPILEPAFTDDPKTRVELTAALNFISNRNIEKGLKKLNGIVEVCQTNADKAAWCFCMGLAFEMAGAKEQYISFYRKAGVFGHRFYLPYMKVAKSAHGDAIFDLAAENYLSAIECLSDNAADPQGKMLLASAYTNYASCLTMMHRYEEAEKALCDAEAALPVQLGREATYAILYAAVGDGAKVSAYISELEKTAPQLVPQTKEMTDRILNGDHPHFSEKPVDMREIAAFWTWFAENESVFSEYISAQKYDELIELLQVRLTALFPFAERDAEFGVTPKDGITEIALDDQFMVSLSVGYEKLISACPEDLRSRWVFSIEH